MHEPVDMQIQQQQRGGGGGGGSGDSGDGIEDPVQQLRNAWELDDMKTVMKLMQSHTSNPMIQQIGCRALRDDGAINVNIPRTLVIPCLVQAMQSHATNHNIQLNALAAAVLCFETGLIECVYSFELINEQMKNA